MEYQLTAKRILVARRLNTPRDINFALTVMGCLFGLKNIPNRRVDGTS
jgi:hypothetical protein